jgi:para-aminobenzoate synthetase component 1
MTFSLPWADPREYAEALKSEANLVFLYSGMEPGTRSFIAWGLEDKLEDLEKLKADIGGYWFGYLGYGLRHELEKLPSAKASHITLPDILMMKFKNLMVFDHAAKTIFSTVDLKPASYKTTQLHNQTTLQSNMTDADFMNKVSSIVAKIKLGELYQANLTRKFYSTLKTDNSLGLFTQLTKISPAPYSAYIKFGDTAIISASPEKFLTVQNGIATTIPIKGTLGVDSPAALLAMSEKDRSENLMIVDLMRNDLSKTCANVRVPELFKVTSYAKYHHMSSTIVGEARASALDIALGCFPPGSMTGAPKIHAMRLINDLEGVERGVYSGAIGYFNGKNECDFSVVIRTLIIQDDKFEFQVGCGIVADSVPEKELEESYIKAKPIMELLARSTGN